MLLVLKFNVTDIKHGFIEMQDRFNPYHATYFHVLVYTPRTKEAPQFLLI